VPLDRRSFLKKSLLGVGLSLMPSFFDLGLKSAVQAADTDATLITIFLRGGNDGLNTLVPFTDSSYYSLRPTLSIKEKDLIKIPDSSLFGFNSALKGLSKIYQDGNLAIFPATYNLNLSFSHFESQDRLNYGLTENLTTGWLNRSLVKLNVSPSEKLTAISLRNNVHEQLRGEFNSLAFDSFDDIINNADFDYISKINNFYNDADLSSGYLKDISKLGQNTFTSMAALKEIAIKPNNLAIYPDTYFSHKLETAARLIKYSKVKAITIDLDGFDTHAKQNIYHGILLKELGDALLALHTDLKDSHNYSVLIMSEFGRTAAENGSDGTDHGMGNCWFAMGPKITGGIYGAWPGLETSQLRDERYLDYSIDAGNIIGELIQHNFKINPELIFNSFPYKKVGFTA
jgi:uncharacterized protein (DUF1501 family)